MEMTNGLTARVEVGLVGVVVRLEISAFFPHFVDALFGLFEIVGFG
jgi:hypothetical protein